MTRGFDVAVVLGAMVTPEGEASPALLRRTAHGVSLYRSGQVRHLLLSGGIVRRPPAEASLMRRAALAAGIPEDAIVTEELARNTLENAVFCRSMLDDRGWHRVLLVTDGYHLPRALYTFRRLGIAAEPAAPPRPTLDGRMLIDHLRELPAFLVYLWRVERALATSPASPRKAG